MRRDVLVMLLAVRKMLRDGMDYALYDLGGGAVMVVLVDVLFDDLVLLVGVSTVKWMLMMGGV